jgi:type III pantothenate kinase
MLLTIDIGNTNTVLGLYEGEILRHHFRVESARGRTRDEYRVLLRSLLDLAEVTPEEIVGAIMASVVPALTSTVAEALRETFSCRPLVVGPGIKTGMPILIDNPREVGADRIVNAVAAYDRIGDAVIVVDFGTATTFDVVSAKGEYLGGIIAPGIQISAEALFSRAAQLPRTEIAAPAKVVGRNTIHSMQSGIFYGYVGLVDGIVERICEELDRPHAVLATGGLASMVQPESAVVEEVDEYLTLEGLRLLYLRNTRK